MNESRHIPFVITALSILFLCAAVAPARAARCGACDVAQERCSANCFGLEGKAESVACRIACDNAAATCSCDEKVTLRSEDLVAKMPWLVADTKAAACHSTTACGAEYGSCAGWSAYSDCGDSFCGFAASCGEDCPEPPCSLGGPGIKQWRERYRVCLNSQAQPCTEYQRTATTLSCGC